MALSVFVLLQAVCFRAGIVSPSQARSVALQCVGQTAGKQSRSSGSTASVQLACVRTSETLGTGAPYPLYYVFNRAGEGGFVIVAGDDRLPSVLAVTEQGNIAKAASNRAFQWWLDAMACTAEQTIADSGNAIRQRTLARSAVLPQYVEPLLATSWGQDEPYNATCPLYAGARCLTGCVATAMAQVCRYWQYPTALTGTFASGTSQVDLSAYPFSYANMQNAYTSSTQTGAADVANLMYACGVAMSMQYGLDASQTELNNDVLVSTFGFDPSCHTEARESVTAENWVAMLKTELAAGRPVIYQGVSSYQGAHQFVCDGYNSDGLFHINWGWGGLQNGYYDISSLSASGLMRDGYVYSQSALIGLQPGCGGTATHASRTLSFDYLSLLSGSGTTLQAVRLQRSGSSVSFRAGIFSLRCNGVPFDGSLGMLLYDSSGRQVGTKAVSALSSLSLQVNSVCPSPPVFTVTVPDTLSDGTYYLLPAAGSGEDDLQPVLSGAGSTCGGGALCLQVGGESVDVEVLGKSSVSGLTVSALGDSLPATVYSGYTNRVGFGISNSGDFVRGVLGVNGVTDQFFIAPGQTRTMYANLYFGGAVGQRTVSVTLDGETIGTFTVNVDTARVGTPQLAIENVDFLSPTVALDGTLQFDVTVSNAGGMYNNVLAYYVSPAEGEGFWTEKNVLIPGGRHTFRFAASVRDVFVQNGLRSGEGYVRMGFYDDAGAEFVGDAQTYAFRVADVLNRLETVAQSVEGRGPVFDLSGMNRGTDLSLLPRGIYIQGGRKIWVR